MPTTEKPKTYKYRFRLESGSHYDAERKITIEAKKRKQDIYDTDLDMQALHGKQRWTRLKTPEEMAMAKEVLEEYHEDSSDDEVDELEMKSIKELRELAVEKEIDLAGAQGKSAIIEAIRAALNDNA